MSSTAHGSALFGTDADSLPWNPHLSVRLMVAVPHWGRVGRVEEDPPIDCCDVIVAKELIISVAVAFRVEGQRLIVNPNIIFAVQPTGRQDIIAARISVHARTQESGFAHGKHLAREFYLGLRNRR